MASSTELINQILIIFGVLLLIVLVIVVTKWLARKSGDSNIARKPMKKGLIIIILLIAIMTVTNPSKSDYLSWAKEQVLNSTKDASDRAIVSLFTNSILETSTTTKNCIVFSIYETKIKKKNQITLGVFKNFIPIN